MKKSKLWFFASAALVLFAGCSNDNSEGIGKYTFHTAISAPSTWSPTDWKMAGEGLVLARTVSGLYDFVLNDSGDGFETVCELAEKFPVDVTKEYAGNKKYGVPASAKNGWAWRVKLIENATWEDGEPITSEDFVYSMQQFLNPEMKNYRASNWYEGIFSLANAKGYYDGEIKNWSDVGLVADDEYTLTFILTKSISKFFAEYALADVMLLKSDLYEVNKISTGDIVKSSYGTTMQKFASYGPYKITAYQADKFIHLEKNEAWYGWTDGRHEDEYQTTGYDIQFITDHNTILNLFLQGNLDDTALTVTDLQRFGNSEWRVNTPQSYTWRLSFNTDMKTLKDEESEGINHSILAYKNFRKGIALSLDRRKYVDTISPAAEPGYGLLNYLYIAEPENGTLYRNTKEAQKVFLELYNAENLEDITGYDIVQARVYIQSAYDEALFRGDIREGDRVQIDYHTYNTSETNMRTVSFLQDAVNEASVGTSLEGLITVKQITDENYMANMTAGKVDLAMSAWGGNSFDPYATLWCYCSPEAIQEYGFDSKKTFAEIELNGKKEKRNLYEWYVELCEGKYVTADTSVRNKILASCEKTLLETYVMIPVTYSTSVSLNSQRVVEGTDTFINDIVKFGGERKRRFTMDDAEWAAYCKRNRNQLVY